MKISPPAGNWGPTLNDGRGSILCRCRSRCCCVGRVRRRGWERRRLDVHVHDSRMKHFPFVPANRTKLTQSGWGRVWRPANLARLCRSCASLFLHPFAVYAVVCIIWFGRLEAHTTHNRHRRRHNTLQLPRRKNWFGFLPAASAPTCVVCKGSVGGGCAKPCAPEILWTFGLSWHLGHPTARFSPTAIASPPFFPI